MVGQINGLDSDICRTNIANCAEVWQTSVSFQHTPHVRDLHATDSRS